MTTAAPHSKSISKHPTSLIMDITVQSYRYHYEEFDPKDLKLDRIDIAALTNWANQQASGQGAAFYFLIHINPQETLGTIRHYWIFVMADVMHEKNMPFDEGELWAKAFDVTQTYRRGFRGIMPEGLDVDRTDTVRFSQFEKGRLYQAADEAARTNNLGRLETLVLEMCRSDAERLGMGFD